MRDMVALSQIDRKVARIVDPILARMGYDLIRLRFGGGRRKTLQIMAERQGGGMELDDCAAVSKAVSAALDVEDPITEGYTLEVSSPGIDRPLTRKSDFETWTGHLVKLETLEPVDGRRRFRGELGTSPEGHVVVDTEDGAFRFDFEAISSARLVLTDKLMNAAASGQDDEVPAQDAAQLDRNQIE